MNLAANEIHFMIACLCQKGVELSLYSCILGLTLKIFMHYWLTFGQYLSKYSCHTLMRPSVVGNKHCSLLYEPHGLKPLHYILTVLANI